MGLLDFFLRSHLKNFTYEPPVETERDLTARLTAACETVLIMPGILDKVYQNMAHHYSACNDVGGGHFTQFL
jgi:hypothetical protein